MSTALPGMADRLDAIRHLIASEIAASRATGVAIPLAADGAVLREAGFGLADVAAARPADAHTPFCLASVTKPFTTAAIMTLVEAGALALDDPVPRHLDVTLPRSDFDTEGMTLRLLGAHVG